MSAGVRICLVTAAAARDLDEDLPPLRAALERLGAAVTVADWDDSSVDWSSFDLAVVRSTWDYATRRDEFLAWAEHAGATCRLEHPPEVLRWNTHKGYLGDLSRAGLPVVPSTFVAPGDEPALPDSGEVVVKPAVGAGSRDAGRFPAEPPTAALAHARRLLGEGRDVVIQPYLPAVDHAGEAALLFAGGELSHAITKGPLLAVGAAPSRALFSPERISARRPSARERRVAEAAIAALGTVGPPGLDPPLYARVDLLPGPDGPLVLEVELSEPSLFLQTSPGAADRFATAIRRRAAARRR